MVNVSDYLHYKLYNFSVAVYSKLSARGDANTLTGFIISLNVTSLIVWIFKIDFKWTFIISALLIIIIFHTIYNKERHKVVIEKYSHESHKQKLIGRFAVIAYVIASIVSAGIVLWHSFD